MINREEGAMLLTHHLKGVGKLSKAAERCGCSASQLSRAKYNDAPIPMGVLKEMGLRRITERSGESRNYKQVIGYEHDTERR